jgi:hypothetical protein
MRLPRVNCRHDSNGQLIIDRRRGANRGTFQLPLFAIRCALLLCLAGCGPHVIYQTATGPVRLAEPINARIWVKDSSGVWTRSTNRVAIPEGFDLLPPPPSSQPGTSFPNH